MLQLVLCVGIREGTCIVRHDIQQVDFVLAMLYVRVFLSFVRSYCVLLSVFVRILDLCKVTGMGFGIAYSFFMCAVNLFGFFFHFIHQHY